MNVYRVKQPVAGQPEAITTKVGLNDNTDN